MRDALAQTANTRSVYFWFEESFKVDYDQLADSGHFESLDIKLANALKKICENVPTLHNNISLGARTAAAEYRAITGRQILWLIDKHFELPSLIAGHTTIDDLKMVSYSRSNGGLGGFLANWSRIMTGMPAQLKADIYNQEMITQLFVKQMEDAGPIMEAW